MFTGIVERVGEVREVRSSGDFARLRIEVGELSEGVERGDSIAVNGACLTVADISGRELYFDVVRESLDRTDLGDLEVGSRVNLERALAAGGRLDGHIVQGHVDGTGRVEALDRSGDDVKLVVNCGEDLAGLLVDKGSVTIDGVSLTVVDVFEAAFSVVLIPHTLAATTLGGVSAGDRVNLEADILGKYVKRYLDRVLPRT